MDISKERLKRLLRAWAFKFWDQLLNGMTLIATLSSVLAVLGLTMVADVPHASLLFFVILAYICWIAYRALPTFHVHPADIANRRIELDELDTLLTPVKCIGLLGKTLVGKTTFLYSATGRKREDPRRQTERPYAIIVQLPDTSPPQYIGLIDSVGEQDASQYEILKRTELVCLFVDHNKSASYSLLFRWRLRQHRYLLQQLINARAGASAGASKMILVANKYDLWKKNPKVQRSMQTFISDCRHEITHSHVFSLVDEMDRFIATSGNDPAQLLEKIKHAT